MENAKEGTDFSEKSEVSEEWLDRYMDSAGFVSSEDIQLIWGKILANEFERPGSTPPNMIRILSEITPKLAMAFRVICSMNVFVCPLMEDGNIASGFRRVFVPYNANDDRLRELGLSFNVLNEPEALGVIRFNSISGYVFKGITQNKVLLCMGNKLEVLEEHKKDEVPIGNVILTSVGEALQSITDPEDIEDYYDMVKKYLNSEQVKLAEKHDYFSEIRNDTLNIGFKRT